MKTKTLIELVTLSSSLYVLTRDTHLLERLSDWTEKRKEGLNKIASDSVTDEDGNELELMDKILSKAEQVKEELESKIEELMAKVYKKINIAHLDEIKGLNEKLEKADANIALLEARLNKLETLT
ncbi:hypothetical protein HNV10_07700 [Winogradskyella litoriviva]|uniref:Uncharacterized protein n=1 Tax=Winogradskyella litoriviva TaxID=1220182 RepID=A0ABX2E5S3_9FLAO|nr:hypothetical protein [Winogradskyella litoriviva]NRD23119.1 hypothetical protein [Winogradskyella litoriviva]